jgi:hypothetical protein
MTAAPMQYATVAAWSTASSCNAMTIVGPSTGATTTAPGACLAPALAIDEKAAQGVLVFEGNDGIRALDLSRERFSGVSQLLALGGSSPRAVFDGQRYWISHLDDAHQLVVGYLDNDELVSTTLDIHPAGTAYDLLFWNGAVWTVTYRGDLYELRRYCIEPTNG